MRIAIVTAHYLPEMGYIESQLARALSAIGHEVRVITSTHIPPRAEKVGFSTHPKGEEMDGDVVVERLSYRTAWNQVVISGGLRSRLKRYAPDLCIAIGIGKLFPAPILLAPEKRDFRLVGLFGNNRYNYRDQWTKVLQKRLVQRIFKDRCYQRAFDNCDLLWCYTPETEQLLAGFAKKQQRRELRRKARRSSLGFDPETDHFDPLERKSIRETMQLDQEDILFITATRPVPSKQLEKLIEAFEAVMNQEEKVHYLLIGSWGSPYAERLKEQMTNSPFRKRFHLLPFQEESILRKYYNAADIGIWPGASIASIKAMGSGLPLLLPQDPALSHLLEEGRTGGYYRTKELTQALRWSLDRFGGEGEKDRKERQEKNRASFSIRAIARDIVERSMKE